MGYFVRTTSSTLSIDNDKLADAYRAMCELNAHDDLKRGGYFGSAAKKEVPADSKSLSRNQNKWFSWMEWNYDETCANAEDIFEALGFTVDQDVDNDRLVILGYDENKTGQEELFFEACAPYCNDGTVRWIGEDGDTWTWVFKNGTLTINYGQQ